MSALKFIQIIARKKAAEQGGKGITTIANRMQAEAKAAEIAETLRASGLTPDKWDDFLKSEKDVIKYLNIIESTKKQAIEQATKKPSKVHEIVKTFFDKKKERPFTGFTPKVVERSMPADDYAGFKEEWFSKILANTDEALNTFLKRGINASDERFVSLSKDQRKDFLDMVEYRLKHGNEKFMNDFTDAKGEFNKFPVKNGRTLNAYGGIAGMLGEPTYADDNHRVPLGGGKLAFDAARRKFLQMLGIGAAGTAAAKSGLLGLLKGGGKKQIVESLTQVPIGSADGMPAWFPKLVNRVIKEGDDVTTKFATKDREIVHATKIGDDDMVTVTQSLDDGTIRVQYNSPDSIGESGVELVYKQGQVIPIKKKGKSTSVKEKDEFTAVEDDFYPQQTSPDGDFDIELTENIVKNVDDLYSDTSKLKQFATGKNLTIKEISKSMKKKNILKEIENNPNEHAFRNVPDEPPYDYASGGRVPLKFGKMAESKDIDTGVTKLDIIPGARESQKLRELLNKLREDRASDGRVPRSGGGIMKLIQTFFKKKPETLKEFIERREFIKGLIGNTTNMKNKRMLEEILEENKKVKGFEFPDAGPGSDIHKEIEMILNKGITKHATGGRVPLAGGLLAKGMGKFSKSDVLLKMFETTAKNTKSANTKKRFLNFIKEMKAKPELANDPQVWNFFTKGLPKNQRFVVHSDDTVDFWTQSKFGPHNIKTTDKFIKKHPHLSRDEAVRIQNMEPEDQILEMKRLETIADRSRTKNATGGRVSLSAGGLAGMLGE